MRVVGELHTGRRGPICDFPSPKHRRRCRQGRAAADPGGVDGEEGGGANDVSVKPLRCKGSNTLDRASVKRSNRSTLLGIGLIEGLLQDPNAVFEADIRVAGLGNCLLDRFPKP